MKTGRPSFDSKDDDVKEITEVLGLPVGGRVIYYRGFLATDRDAKSEYCADAKLAPAVHETGTVAYNLSQKGLVNLFQRRIGPRSFEYIAERRK